MWGDEMKDNMTIKGRVTVRTYDKSHEAEIQRLFSLGYTANQIAEMIPAAETEVVENMVITTGRQLIFRLLKGDTTVGLKYLAIGTNTTPPAMDDDWADVAESFRKLITSFAFDNSSLYCDTFIATAEANFTWQEVVICGDSTASGTAETGVIFSRALLNQVKTDTQTKTVSWQYTLS
ncbi:MAG: hypothetical protein Kow00111_28540 [Thermincola ferriacetica]